MKTLHPFFVRHCPRISHSRILNRKGAETQRKIFWRFPVRGKRFLIGVEHCFGRTSGKALAAHERDVGVIQMLVVLQ